jgi:hypothetical protein
LRRGRGRGRGGRVEHFDQTTRTTTDNDPQLLICTRCGTHGHDDAHCRIPSHLVKLYQESAKNTSHEAHGAFLENVDMLDDYIPDNDPPLETHLVNHIHASLSSDDMNTCIVDSGTSHTILRSKECFTQITPSHRTMTTIMGSDQIEEGHGPATITLPRGTSIHIRSAIYAPNATKNLISFKDIWENGYHIQTSTDNSQEAIHIVQQTPHGMEIKETIFAYPLGFYVTQLNAFHSSTNTISLYDM